MKSISALMLLGVALFFGLSGEALAQQERSTQEEFWPELDVFIRLNRTTRIFLLTGRTQAREFPYTEGVVGAHLDFGLPPKIRIALNNIDASKMQYLSFRVGYRYNRTIHDNGDPFREHRPIIELTPRFPLPASLLLSDRNRIDLRWVNGFFSWRYRNRVTLEREFKIGEKYALTPYASGELYYDSRFNSWNRNRYGFGLQTMLTRYVMIDLYYMRQNDSRSRPNVNAIGAALNLFF